MPISYNVSAEGHFIHAIAKRPLTRQEFIDYEVAHAFDKRVKPPVSELFEIAAGAFEQLTMDDMREVLRRRSELKRPPLLHRCAIVLRSYDDHSWDLAAFYEGMVMLHSPEAVIVFAQADIARKWLGFEDLPPPDAGDST